MEVKVQIVSANSSRLVAATGEQAPALISHAWNFSSVSEDIFIENAGKKYAFMIIPLSEGTIEVELAGGEIYTIQESEVSASIGQPLAYLCKRIIAGGNTTVTNLTVGL